MIPTRGRSRALRETVLSCLRQTLPPHCCEIVVVANPPSTAVQSLLEELRQELPDAPRLHYQGCQRLGANAARNSGLRLAKGEVIFFLDDDCILAAPDHLKKVLEAHDRDRGVDAIGGIYLSPENASRACQYYNAFMELWLERNRTSSGDPLVLLGGNASYKRRVFANGCSFNEDLAYGGTETELNHRLVSCGSELRLAEELPVIHNFRGSWRSILFKAWAQGRGKAEDSANGNLPRRRGRWRALRKELHTLPRPRSGFLLFASLYSLTAQLAALLARSSKRHGGAEDMENRKP